MEGCFIGLCNMMIADMERGFVRKKDGDLYSLKTIRTMRSNLSIVKEFVSSTRGILQLEDINQEFVEDFQQFLLNKNLAKNTIAHRLDFLKFWINRFYSENLIEFTCEKKKHSTEVTTAIAFTLEELQTLYALKLPDGQKKILDIFICQCFLGLRVGDLFKFLQNVDARKRVIDDQLFFEILTGKNGHVVVIPASKVVCKIIEKYGASLQKGFSESYYNSTLKKIVAKSSIERQVIFCRTQGGRRMEKIVPLSALVSSHTARRTFATNGYLSGISPFDLMKITGHKSLHSFFRYMRCENISVALKISTHHFFQVEFSDAELV